MVAFGWSVNEVLMKTHAFPRYAGQGKCIVPCAALAFVGIAPFFDQMSHSFLTGAEPMGTFGWSVNEFSMKTCGNTGGRPG